MTKKPFVIAKWAMSLDGKTVTHVSDSRQISSSTTQSHFHYLRQKVSAIIVGANTIKKDNPQLTARKNGEHLKTQPLRIILTRNGNLPLDFHVFSENLPGKTLIATTTNADKQWLCALKDKNIESIILPSSLENQIDLHALLEELGKRSITSILIEGGMTLLESFFQENLVNKIYSTVSPFIIGKSEKKHSLQFMPTQSFNDDVIFTAYPKEAKNV